MHSISGGRYPADLTDDDLALEAIHLTAEAFAASCTVVESTTFAALELIDRREAMSPAVFLAEVDATDWMMLPREARLRLAKACRIARREARGVEVAA